MKDKDYEPLHWSQHEEQTAGYWHVKLLLIIFKIFPVFVLRIIAFPVGFFYFLFSKKGRTESQRFLGKAAALVSTETAKKCRSPFGSLRHIISFSLSLVEKIETWGGKFPFRALHFQDDDVGDLVQNLENGKGVFVITSHLGNIELLRGLASYKRTGMPYKVQVTAVVDVKMSKHFTRMLRELNSRSTLDIISVHDIGAHTALLLEEKLAAGEMVTIAGDRTSVGGTEKNILIPFFGDDAPFSPGAFYMALLMQVPVYFIFALRRKDLSLRPEYDMHVCKCSVSSDCGRKERVLRSAELARSYAAVLECYCKEKPFQWYNFYDFWSKEV